MSDFSLFSWCFNIIDFGDFCVEFKCAKTNLFTSYSYLPIFMLIPTSNFGHFPTCQISLGQIPISILGHFPTCQISLGQIPNSQYLGSSSWFFYVKFPSMENL